MIYNILDFNAVTKHSYYGQKNRTQDTLICEATGEEVVNWHAAVNDFLSRYMDIMENPRDIIVAHDMGSDYRKAFFPEYKANRSKREISPLEREQIAKAQDWIKNFLSAVGATQIGVKGVEADDVIAWLVGGQEVSAVVHTVDADLLQLVSDSCMVSLKGELHTAGGSHKDIPYQITSLSKSVLGDTSDGYKGVPGVGPAKFMDVLETVGLDNLLKVEKLLAENELNKAEELLSEYSANKTVQTLLNSWSEWYAQYRLAALHPELCYRPRGGKLTKPIIHKRMPNGNRVKSLLEQVGALDLWDEKYAAMMPTRTLLSSENWAEMKDKVKKQMLEGRLVAYDYETSDKNPKQRFRKASTKTFVDNLSQEITGISFCCGEFNQHVYYMTVDHKDSPNLGNEEVKELLIHMARNAHKVTLVAHNAFFEGTVTQKQLGISFGGVQDTRIMQRYADENSSAGLKDMSLQYLGYHQATYEDTLAAAGADKMCDMTWQQAFDYGADDAEVTAHLYDIMKLLLQVDGSWIFYKKWAVEPTQVLQSAYLKGVNINWALQKRLHEEDLQTIEESMKELREMLQEHVTGEVTEGCKSLIESEKKYIRRGLEAKDSDTADEKFSEWESKLKAACNYVPYMETKVMPTFSYTAKQVSAAAEAVGLPSIEKLTQTAIREYFSELGLDRFDPPEYSEEQEQFLELFQEAVEARIDKLAKEYTEWRQTVFDKFGTLCQKLSGVEPKVVAVGDALNMGSSKQMQELMYCKIGVPVRLFGQVSPGRLQLGIRDGSPSTDEKAIETALALDAKDWQVDALKLMLKAKSALTRVTLFHNKLPLWVHDDGRVHPFITDAGTDTRRPTGGSPNILQIPSRGEMRSLWMPPSEEFVCVAIDFSGQELRILANESNDEAMMGAYIPGAEKDIHSTTAVGIIQKRVAGDPSLKPLTEFSEFETARRDDSHPLNIIASTVRGHAKTCIAKGQKVLTDKGEVPIEDVTLDHKVWDGVEFVKHGGVIYKGVQNVISYGSLIATPDHEVYLHDGTKQKFGDFARSKGWDGRMDGSCPRAGHRNTEATLGKKGGEKDLHPHKMHVLSRREGERSLQPDERKTEDVPVSATEVDDESTHSTSRQVLLSATEVRESQRCELQELRSKGDTEQVRECGCVCGVCDEELTSPRLQEDSCGSYRQQRALRTRKPEISNRTPESGKQEDEQVPGLQRTEGGLQSRLASYENGPSRTGLSPTNSGTEAKGGVHLAGTGEAAGTYYWRSEVYDITDCGPRNRFSVSGIVVSNCNFGLAYGSGPTAIARNLIVELTVAEDLLAGTMGLYKGVPIWQQATAKFMEKEGYTQTAFGTKRHATEDLFSKDKGKVSRVHRQGINAVIQGAAAEALRTILTRLHTEQWIYKLRMEFFAPIYDEIVAWVHKDDVVQYCNVMYKLMTEATPPGHKIPQVPEFSIGPDWGRCHELGQKPSEERILKAVEDAIKEGAEVWATDMQLTYFDVFGKTPEEMAES